jgi:hypothetical protein
MTEDEALDPKKYVAAYLEVLAEGEYDVAYHGLSEGPPGVAPILEDVCLTLKDPEARATVVEAFSAINRLNPYFLYLNALNDPEPRVWKAALDAMLTVGMDLIDELRRVQRSLQCRERPPQAAAVEEAVQKLRQHLDAPRR